MDALLSEAERRWRDEAIQFAREQLGEDPSPRDQSGTFWREGYERCARFGLAGLPIPTTFGGRGGSLAETVAAMEGLGYGCTDTGLPFGLGASLWTVAMPILEYGSEEQKRTWLPGLCDGRFLGCNAASEPEAGSDIYSLTTSARRDGDGWTLDGHKIWITAAPVANVFVVFATTAPDRGALGVTAFLVPADTPGLRVVRSIPKLGLRSAPMGEVRFEDCRLPADAVLGREGRGARVFQSALEYERGAILAPVLGTMRRQLETCIEHARRRKQFGQPIGKFQAVAHRIVEMSMRLEAARPFVYAFARARTSQKDAMREASMAKLQVSEAFAANSQDALRTFGGLGYAVEGPVERDLRDSQGGLIFSGTNDIQKNIIAQALRL